MSCQNAKRACELRETRATFRRRTHSNSFGERESWWRAKLLLSAITSPPPPPPLTTHNSQLPTPAACRLALDGRPQKPFAGGNHFLRGHQEFLRGTVRKLRHHDDDQQVASRLAGGRVASCELRVCAVGVKRLRPASLRLFANAVRVFWPGADWLSGERGRTRTHGQWRERASLCA